MRTFISIFIVMALAVATSLPATSHAMMSRDHVKIEQTKTSDKDNCHKSIKTSQNDKESGKGCGKGMCKCIDSNCHNGLSKIFNNSDSLFFASSNEGRFAFTTEVVESALLSRLKRPPRA